MKPKDTMKNTSPYRVPAPVRQLLSRLPGRPGAWLFTAGLNAVLRAHLDADVRRALERKRLQLAVLDAGVAVDFCWNGRAFAAPRTAGTPDLVIAATLYDLGLLAMRKEDPDTLFFSRRLVMEGDTELGLLIKNTLDAIDPSTLFERLRPRHRSC
jgi:O2-independent ubiquinone biosynthesis accessory factor UbiT